MATVSSADDAAVSFTVPDPEQVGAFYDGANEIIARFQGGNMHYGYWTGPDDDSTYEQAGERFTDIMVDKLGAGPGDRVLDLGCGPGKPAVRLARRTGASVVGISISGRDVELATARARAEGLSERVRFQRANAMELPFPDDSFDHVLAFESIVHMPDRAAVLREIVRVLRPGGRVSLTDFIRRRPEAGRPDDERALAAVLDSWRTAPLVRIEDYTTLTAAAGLALDEVTDVTQHTKYSNLHFYRSLHEYARDNPVSPEVADILAAGPGESGLRWLVEQDPAEGVIVAVAHLPRSAE
jgi:ubiquinone/menaquinone biosynthesis C-methylase UbiE